MGDTRKTVTREKVTRETADKENNRHWPSENELRAKEARRVDETCVAEMVAEIYAVTRAYRLAEIRKDQGLTQAEVAGAMNVSQQQVSAVERGELSRTELGTIGAYVEALGGKIEIVANFGEERLVVG